MDNEKVLKSILSLLNDMDSEQLEIVLVFLKHYVGKISRS